MVGQLLRIGEVQVVKLRVAFLQMGWNGVVDDGMYAEIGEPRLQFVAMGREDGEYVIDVAFFCEKLWQCDERIVHIIIICTRYMLPHVVVLVEKAELGVEHRCLYLVESTVASLVLGNVFAAEAIIGQSANHVGESVIVCRHGSTVSHCSEVFAWVEAVAAC